MQLGMKFEKDNQFLLVKSQTVTQVTFWLGKVTSFGKTEVTGGLRVAGLRVAALWVVGLCVAGFCVAGLRTD